MRILFIFLIIILLFDIIINNNINFFNDNYLFCDNQIYSYNILKQSDINKLCQELNKNKIFSIFLTKIENYNNFNYDENYFSENCNIFFKTYNKNQNNGIGLCIYILNEESNTANGKIRLITGKDLHDYLTDYIKKNILNNLSVGLRDKKYFDTLIRMIDYINMIVYDEKEHNNNNHNNHEINDNNNENHGFLFKFFFYFLLPLGIIAGVYYYYIKNMNKNNNNNNNNNQNDFPLLNNYPNYNEINNNNLIAKNIDDSNIIYKIRNHIFELENLIYQIRKSNPPILSIDKCLLCFSPIIINNSQNIEMTNFNNIITNNNNFNNNNNIEPINIRFQCQHIYHTKCLKLHNLNICFMCIGPDNAYKNVIPNNYNTQIIDERQIKNLIINFNAIYNVELLKEYIKTFPEEFNKLNIEFNYEIKNYWNV